MLKYSNAPGARFAQLRSLCGVVAEPNGAMSLAIIGT